MANCDDPFTKPSTFKALIPSPVESVCAQFRKFINFISEFYTWYSEMFDEDGCATQKFIDAVGGSGTNTTTTAAPGTTTTGTTTAAPATGQQIWSSPGVESFVVPAGITTITMKMWGAGGGGGDGSRPPSSSAPFPVGAGGGGGGGGYSSQNITVTPGETLTVTCPAGGAGGTLVGFTKNNGSNGGDAKVERGAATIADATGGSGGQAGYQPCGGLFVGGAGGAGGIGTTANGSNGTAATPESGGPCLNVAAGLGGAGANGGIGNGGNSNIDNSGSSGASGRVQFIW